ncbi:type II secretion system protein [Cerasicoccus maritimus]|uniref:type II secretion system protein n=1 Tax=Cerasicoccus maritimus TaxID=490089 RepID=UPI002852D203|nr:type II secretion system protein [Cerasicoccus maritimus]
MCYRNRPGFTLIELLTVIAIIGVLAAILIPAVGAVQESARKSNGAASMREVGSALHLYTQEHDSRYPGPLWPGQVPLYDPDRGEEDGRLAYYLAPYLDVPTNATPPVLVEAMVPAAYPIDELYQSSSDEPRTYILNIKAKNPNSSELINVWGLHPDMADDESESIPQATARIIAPATTWALMDVDQLHPNAGVWKSNTPEKPIYGDVRQVLFFDGHVEEVDVSQGLPD